MKSLFMIKPNGRRFRNALAKAANDPNVGEMFLDNLDPDGKNIVMLHIINGNFRSALIDAFDWGPTKEKEKFWRESYNNIKDYKPNPKGAKSDRSNKPI